MTGCRIVIDCYLWRRFVIVTVPGQRTQADRRASEVNAH
jgi:hypothetical protein